MEMTHLIHRDNETSFRRPAGPQRVERESGPGWEVAETITG